LTDFDNFLHAEYQNIAQAHFKSIETISSFFKYYLLVMAVPLSALAVIFQAINVNIFNVINNYFELSALSLILISFIGIFLFWYIVNLRFDTVLYARTVNGIRKHFYSKSNIDVRYSQYIRTLPQSNSIPHYFEAHYFLPVVLTFGFVNSIYLILSYIIIELKIFNLVYCSPISIDVLLQKLISFLIFIILHVIIYYGLSLHRERSYLKSKSIGIDIDGVLNNHATHFIDILNKKMPNHRVSSDDILILPVHKNPKFKLSSENERSVFNDPDYWINMPVINDVSLILNRLKHRFKVKVYFFTARGWPDLKSNKALFESFNNFINKTNSKLLYLLPRIKLFKNIPIDTITIKWLKANHFKYNKLFIEHNNYYSSDIHGIKRNRIYVANKMQIRFFIEDDLINAIKLSYICEVVFLITHPYNLMNRKLSIDENRYRKSLPPNIFRVKDFNEIERIIQAIL